ncbi:Fic family protein [bacterium]|nr:Fic family protein [bacterium]
MIHYRKPDNWIKYNLEKILPRLVEAQAAILALRSVPYQKSWVDSLQNIELKREIAGTSRIEGADFSDKELDEALASGPEEFITRSQRQARAAAVTYRWIAAIPADRPLDGDIIKEIHHHIVTGADDDHCRPGMLRGPDENVNFGQPRHRGVNGGDECTQAFAEYVRAIQTAYREHSPIIQAFSAHYHFAAMHPFLDGNGRTARALEALLLQRAGLRDACFISMSNYYYDEKINYLKTLSESHTNGHDITPFLILGLNGLTMQVGRLMREINRNISKAIFRNVMFDLFGKLESPRKRVIAKRQIEILKVLLDEESMELFALFGKIDSEYSNLQNDTKAFVRDLSGLKSLGAIELDYQGEHLEATVMVRINLEWPRQITKTDFLRKMKSLPQVKGLP